MPTPTDRSPSRAGPRVLALGVLLGLTLLGAPACRGPSGPSPEFTEAHQRFSRLYGQRGDEAFTDPELAQVEALLARVPERSVDAPAARELAQRIRDGRARAEARAAELARALESSRAPPPAAFGSGSQATPPPEPPDAGAPEEQADAGAGPRVGTTVEQLRRDYLGCFAQAGSVHVVGRGERPTWEWVDRAVCRLRYAAYRSQLFIVEDGKVLAVVDKAQSRPDNPDAGR